VSVYNEQAIIGIMFAVVASSLLLTSRSFGQYQCQQWFFSLGVKLKLRLVQDKVQKRCDTVWFEVHLMTSGVFLLRIVQTGHAVPIDVFERIEHRDTVGLDILKSSYKCRVFVSLVWRNICRR
jgi:hypothetical protein